MAQRETSRGPRFQFDERGELKIRDHKREAVDDAKKAAKSGKEKLQEYSFKESGKDIYYTSVLQEADDLLGMLKGEWYGFDIERRPTFVKGERENVTAVAQVSDGQSVIVCHLTAMGGIPRKLATILGSAEIIKVGVGIQEDAARIARDWGVEVRNCVDLNVVSRSRDSKRGEGKGWSLATMVQVYLGRALAKRKRVILSNWEKEPLSREQIEYAGNDASSAYQVYQVLMEDS